ncbi:MAG: hypothetical protein KGH76_05500 [Thaumarchaeota archaeon]|nr:hypothetical protein [Nitrososphaerota archaeon]
MPDESCRMCGGNLVSTKSCNHCRKPLQKKCKSCDTLTHIQYHKHGVVDAIKDQKPLVIPEITTRTKTLQNHFHFYLAVVCIVGLGVSGLVGMYFDESSIMPDAAQATTSNEIKVTSNLPITNTQSYNNCLAYGSGESITVTCPTNDGTIYKGILNMPNDLSKDFTSSVFSIRGISVTEHNGTVILQYHMKSYVTNYFGN